MATLLGRNTQLGASRSPFSGQNVACRATPVVVAPIRAPAAMTVQAGGRTCQLTGTKRNKANVVTFSNKHSRKWQYPNLQYKKVYWAAGQRWVSLRITTRALKTVAKRGLDAMAKEAGIDLWKLPFEDARPERLAYLAENKGKVPVAANPRKMKNPEKLAASTKQPKYPVYEEGGRIVWIRPGMEALVFGEAAASAAAPAATAAEGDLKITVSE